MSSAKWGIPLFVQRRKPAKAHSTRSAVGYHGAAHAGERSVLFFMLPIIRVLCCALLLLVVHAAVASEPRPSSQSDVKKGLERGAALRAQTKLLPGVLQKHALIMKVGGVRCGHAVVTIEDAKGDGGATYKLTEQFKAAMANAGETALFDYNATFLLGADLGVLAGQLRSSSDLTKTADGKRQSLVLTGTLTMKDDALFWQLSEQKKDAKEATLREEKRLPLYGVRPIPKNALFALAAFQSALAKDGWQPDPKEAVCVATLECNEQMEAPSVEPAWVSFDRPGLNDPKGTAVRMRVRLLVGEVADKGLEVEPPEPAVWQSHQDWPLDAQWRPLAHPSPDPESPSLAAEAADPAALDVNAVLDLEKIAAAMKANEAVERKKE
jgi:hypothetical protein